jgi:spermidine synthase
MESPISNPIPRACSPLRTGLLITLLWCSGFCGISYEILYGRLLGNLLGDQFGVSAAVLLTFLLGIGLGTLYAHRWQRWLWAVEFGIGLCGVAFAFLIDPLGDLLYGRLNIDLTGLGGAMLLSSLLLFLPTFLIGATLPLFAGYLNRASGRSMFSNTYLVYNFAAALTALGIEYWLVREVGLKLATLIIANLNFVVCAGIFFGFPDFWRKQPNPPATPPARPWPAGRLLLGLTLASIASAIFQLTMIKVAEAFLGPFRETFALVLAVTLLGIAVGAILVRRWKPSFAGVIWFALAGLAWLFWRQETLLADYAASYPAASETIIGLLWLKLTSVAWLMGPAAIGFGATIPALLTDESAVSQDSGRLLCVSSIANAGGFLLMAFVLHERFEYGMILLIVTGLAIVAALLGHGLKWRILFPPLAAAGIYFGPAKGWDEPLLYLGYSEFHAADDLAEARKKFDDTEVFKGRQDNFAITKYNGRPYLLINGYRSIMLDTWYEKGVGAITSAFAPRLDEALVLGLGAGATAASVGLAFEHTDVVEINPVLVRNQYRFKKYNFDIAGNSRVNLILDDGIHYLRATRKKYSLILNTVTSPLYFSSSKLYTEDFLLDVRRRLTPDGIYMTWLDSRIGEQGVDILLGTVAQVFPHCRLAYVRSGYFLLIASTEEPARVWHPEAAMKPEKLRNYLFKGHDLNPAWMPYSVIVPDAYTLIGDPSAPLNTLDRPALEFVIASLRNRGYSAFRTRLRQGVAPYALGALNTTNFTWRATHFVAHSEDMLSTDNWLRGAIRTATRPLIPDFDNARELARADFFAERAAHGNAIRDHYWTGVWARRGHDYDRAIEKFRGVLARDPKYNNAWYGIGLCLERKGEIEAAFTAFERELEHDSDDSDVPPRLGRIRFGQGRYAEAIRWLSRALEEKEDPELRRLRGEAFEQTGHRLPALADFRKALSDSDNREAAVAGLVRLLKEKPAKQP